MHPRGKPAMIPRRRFLLGAGASLLATPALAQRVVRIPREWLPTDIEVGRGDRVSVLVNSLGATPPEELYILYRTVKTRLERAGATIVMPLVGRYATSMEMAGVSFTLLKLDEELEGLLSAPCDCAFWRVA